MKRISLAQRKRACENQTLCDPASKQKILTELCEMRLSELFPEYYTEAESDEECSRMYEIFEAMTFGEVAEKASDIYNVLTEETSEDSCFQERLNELTFIMRSFTLPFAESARIENAIFKHRIMIPGRRKSVLDYRFWNDVFFQTSQANKTRGFCITRTMTFEEYFQTLLSMTDNDSRIEELRKDYIAEYGAEPKYIYKSEHEEIHRYYYHSDDTLRLACFDFMYDYSEIDDYIKSQNFANNECAAVYAACELIAVPLGILNQHINNKRKN